MTFVLFLRVLSELFRCVALNVYAHSYVTVGEEHSVMHCSLEFALLTQNRFGHREIKIWYSYEFLAVQLNLLGDVHDRSICNLDAKNVIAS